MTTPPEFDAFLATFGNRAKPELKKAARGSLFVGVFVMSRVGEAKSFIGTTSSPHDIAKQLHRFSWEETQCDLVAWTESKLFAARLLKIVKAGLEPAHHRDSWYGLQGDRAATIVLHLAAEARIEVFGDEERSRRLEARVTREVLQLKTRMDGVGQIKGLPSAREIVPVDRGDVITFPTNPRRRG